MKTFFLSAFMLMLSVCTALTVTAQNTDLPNPDANIQTLPVGSFVIAMDNANQNAPGYFNLKSYGLIVSLQNLGVRLRWVIKSGKAHGDADFSVTAEKAFPTFVAAGGTPKDFKAGPFVIFPTDTALARIGITLFNNSLSNSSKVNIYRTTASVNVDVRYDLKGVKPKAAILNDGGKGSIQQAFMVTASIPTTNYAILDSAVNLYNGCYTFASEPHNDGGGGFPIDRIVDSLKDFVARGGNFLAQCHAISTYENFRQVQSSNGITGGGSDYKTSNVLIPDANVGYSNADMSYAQFDGIFKANQTGFMQTWQRFPGGTALNNFYPVIVGNTAATDSIFGATVTKHVSGKGGLIFYLGNHTFSGSAVEDLNGQRMYLNAFLTPAAYASCPLYECVGTACGPLPIVLSYFKAKKSSAGQVQLNWTTTTELQAKEFIVERSFDGINFVGIRVIAAHGTSSSTLNYDAIDPSPVKGYNYYRLTEVSNDGRKTYSEIVSVYFSGKNMGLEIYPTVTHQNITVDMNAFANNNTISVYDLNGKTVINKLRVSGNSVKLDVSNLSAGTYILKAVSSNGTILQNRFVVVKN
ncbi:T9SS type A sorting domain-containing protein [Ferruginibacter sp. SUN002]|uniref:T9SS type A sorting domain-containing protein n=1 Tax=Ferruginibacter sp. SUN002 TaxID=2937789 RepID=UPI003D35B526